MVGIIVSLKKLEKKLGLPAGELSDELFKIKCTVDSIEGDEVKIDVTSDRPDLLSLEGILRYLNGINGKSKGIPELKISLSKEKLIIDSSLKKIRPIVVAALVDCELNDEEFESLIQIQEKLTLTHGRRRKKVAVGVHDASKIKFPITYTTGKPSEKFVPLKEEKEMSLERVLLDTEKGREYAFILEGLKEYPVIRDADGKIISFPPILNSAVTTVTAKTRKLLVELTGTDFDACNSALAIMLQDFSDKGWKIHSIQGGGFKNEPKKMVVAVEKVSKTLGVSLTQKQLISLLEKARLGIVAKGTTEVIVSIPVYRTDFLHWIDVAEEAAIAFGLNELRPVTPRVFTVGSLSEETLLEDKVQDLLVGFGFTEVSTHVLTSPEKNALAFSEKQLIKIKNPVSSDFNALRGTLLPSLMQVLSRNTHLSYPQKLFEIGEVVTHEAKREQRALTKTNLCVIDCSASSNLSNLASILPCLFKDFVLRPFKSKQFIEGRAAEVIVKGEVVGVMGEASPELLSNYGVQMPASILEVIVFKDRK
ncbi:MAG: phenylalanine--tRNA ligase subunit beta [Candidatus Micrarchaeota archaeon]